MVGVLESGAPNSEVVEARDSLAHANDFDNILIFETEKEADSGLNRRVASGLFRRMKGKEGITWTREEVNFVEPSIDIGHIVRRFVNIDNKKDSGHYPLVVVRDGKFNFSIITQEELTEGPVFWVLKNLSRIGEGSQRMVKIQRVKEIKALGYSHYIKIKSLTRTNPLNEGI